MRVYNDEEIDDALSILSETEYGPFLPAIREILVENLRGGRAQRFSKNGILSLVVYARQIAETLKRELTLIEQLASKNDDAWTQQYQNLRFRAYLNLLKLGVDHAEAHERSNDFAQDTCLALWSSRYPGDVPHMAWAQRILYNKIGQKLRRQPDLLDYHQVKIIHLDQNGDTSEIDPQDDTASTFDEQIEKQQMLEWAINHLASEAQRRVVRLKLAGCSDEEIATQTGKSMQAVYNLWHRASRSMRKVLADSWYTPSNFIDE